jgi:hypothetical protein
VGRQEVVDQGLETGSNDAASEQRAGGIALSLASPASALASRPYTRNITAAAAAALAARPPRPPPYSSLLPPPRASCLHVSREYVRFVCFDFVQPLSLRLAPAAILNHHATCEFNSNGNMGRHRWTQ